MQTIKLPYSASNSDKDYILMLQRQQNIAIRYEFNRINDSPTKLSQIQLTEHTKNINNVELLDTWFLQSAVYKAQETELTYIDHLKEIQEHNYKNPSKKKKIPTVIFGGKDNFEKRSEKKMKKSEWEMERLMPIHCVGEALQSGNRKFRLKVIENNTVIFQPDRYSKIEITLPKLHKNHKKTLYKLQEMSENKYIPISFELDLEYIYINYEETFLNQTPVYSPVKNRYMTMDLNPNYIGYSIIDWRSESDKTIVKTGILTNKDINDAQLKLDLSSDDPKNIYWNNKREHETFEVAKKLVKIAKSFNVEKFGFEGLSIESSDKCRGKTYNRKVNNFWNRSEFIKNLIKRLKLAGIIPKDVVCAYSSFIGNLLNLDYPDPIAASIEINRRLYKLCHRKSSKDPVMFPDFKVCKDALITSLEEIDKRLSKFLQDSKDWKEFYKRVKDSKLRYRVPLERFYPKVFSLKSRKSKVQILECFSIV